MRNLLQRGTSLLFRRERQTSRPVHVYAMRLERGSGVTGTLLRLSPNDGDFSQATIAPGGGHVAYWGRHQDLPGCQIWVADIQHRSCRPLTRGPRVHGHPAWFPDGRTLVYFATEDAADWHAARQFDVERPPAHLYRHCLESGAARRLTESTSADERPVVTPDGTAVIFVSNRSGTGLNLWALDLEKGDIRQLTEGSLLDYRPVVAPDGQKIAYFTSDDAGKHILATISWPEARPLPLALKQDFAWLHGPWWAADSRHLIAHGLVEGDARPALWRLDSLEGHCQRVTLPGVRDSSHGSVDRTETWLAFDSRQDLRLPPPAVTVAL